MSLPAPAMDEDGGPPRAIDALGIGGDHPDEDLVEYLERDQLVAETFRPVPRAHLSGRAVMGLWALRIFAVTVSLMVIYTFLASLR